MKHLILLLFLGLFTSAAFSQEVTLSETNAPLTKIFAEIKKQTGYTFFYSDNDLKQSKPVTIQVKNAALSHVLDKCFSDQPLIYSIVDRTIVVKLKSGVTTGSGGSTSSLIDVKGRVVDETGKPVIATVQLKGSNRSISSNDDGYFVFINVNGDGVLVTTGLNIENLEVRILGKTEVGDIKIKEKSSPLNDIFIQGYYSSSKRLSTASTGKISEGEISKQPVENPLLALHGRITGVDVVQSSGVAGSNVKIQIRGRNSLAQGSDPLFIIDGVPFAPNNDNVNSLVSQISGGPGMGLSPFTSIKPDEI